MGKTYEWRTTVTIKDTNLLQNVYFANYFDLQGHAREMWVRDCVPGAVEAMQQGLVLVTHDATCKFHKDFYLYDEVVVRCWFDNLRHASVDMFFEFRHAGTGDVHAEGRQTIVSAGPDHKPVRAPESFRGAILEYYAGDVAALAGMA